MVESISSFKQIKPNHNQSKPFRDQSNYPFASLFYPQVMSFNILERPYWLGREGQRERTCRIPQWIFDHFADVDVIGFQVTLSRLHSTVLFVRTCPKW